MNDPVATTKTRTRTRAPLTGQMKGMLTASEAAEALGVSEGTLAAWRNAQKNIAYYKVLNVIGYKREDIDKCIKEHMSLVCVKPLPAE